MTFAVETHGLGKQYVRGAAQRHFHTLRDALSEWAGRAAGRKPPPESGSGTEQFWALKDVSFAIEPGEVVGIIGRNGSGKSTLLKIIAQITAPTVGEVRLHGRTGTLLEVGTGFHPELTGRENVFLNGTILGMHRTEIAQKFDEIVAFSGVEDFIDTPVKRYSSGMQMRLAFAVAAHLDPEILVIDEVLVVGDAEFQKKCLGKIEDLSHTGRTILFVSHNMAVVDQLCQRVILLDHGSLIEDSTDAYALTSRYLFGDSSKITASGEWRTSPGHRLENDYFSLNLFRVRDDHDNTISTALPNDQQAIVEISLTIKKQHPNFTFGYSMTNEAGTCVYWSTTTDEKYPQIIPGKVLLSSAIPKKFLNQGLFRLELIAAIHHLEWFSEPNATPVVAFLRINGVLRDSRHWPNTRPGVLAPNLTWHTRYV